MPFHGVITDFVAPDLTKPSLEGLAYLLEHPELWPAPKGKRWIWDFSTVKERNQCGTAGCAYGIAQTVWRGSLPSFTTASDAGCVEPGGRKAFRLGGTTFDDIFSDGCHDSGIGAANIAGRIRQHLRGEEITYTGA